MKKAIVLAMLAIMVAPGIATPDPPTDFPLPAGHHDYGYSWRGYPCYVDPTAQIVQAMSIGLGKTLDGATGPDERKEIIGKWLKIIEVSRTDVLKSRQENLGLREGNLRLQEENLKLREAIFELRKENSKLQRQIERLRQEMSELREAIGKLRLEKDEAASKQEE